jgi:hypothetical protein
MGFALLLIVSVANIALWWIGNKHWKAGEQAFANARFHYGKAQESFASSIHLIGNVVENKQLRQHIRAGIEADNAMQARYESGPDAPERGVGECLCTWCTDSRELLKQPTTVNGGGQGGGSS